MPFSSRLTRILTKEIRTQLPALRGKYKTKKKMMAARQKTRMRLTL